MFLSEGRSEPNNRDGLEACCIREQLPQMVVVRALKLVLNQDIGASLLPTDNVGPERAERLFNRFYLERQPECLAQKIEVVRVRQPRREPLGFSRPDLPQVNLLKPC